MSFGLSILHPSAVNLLVSYNATENTIQLIKILSSILCLKGKDRSSLLIVIHFVICNR